MKQEEIKSTAPAQVEINEINFPDANFRKWLLAENFGKNGVIIENINQKFNNLTDYAISWYAMLKEKYGKDFPRKTIVRSFDNI